MDTKESNATSWRFILNINNATPHEFSVQNKNLDWGNWEIKPQTIPAKTNITGLEVYASRGAWGYEFSCGWQGTGNTGSFDLRVDVPYTGSNSSSFHNNTIFTITGWDDLPSGGHQFTKTITITEKFGEDTENNKTPDSDLNYDKYLKLITDTKIAVTDWSSLEKLKVLNSFDPLEFLPQKYHYPPDTIFIGRAEKMTIEKKYWSIIQDPEVSGDLEKSIYVDEYFACAVYSINTNPRSVATVPAHTNVVEETSVEVSSAIRTVLESSYSIRTTLGATGSNLSAQIEGTYSCSHILEESFSRIERKTQSRTIEASEKNRLFVPWVFSTALAIYRKRKTGEIALIGISEWADLIIDQFYEYDGPVNVQALRITPRPQTVAVHHRNPGVITRPIIFTAEHRSGQVTWSLSGQHGSTLANFGNNQARLNVSNNETVGGYLVVKARDASGNSDSISIKIVEGVL